MVCTQNTEIKMPKSILPRLKCQNPKKLNAVIPQIFYQIQKLEIPQTSARLIY